LQEEALLGGWGRLEGEEGGEEGGESEVGEGEG